MCAKNFLKGKDVARKTKPLNDSQMEAMAKLVDQYSREVERVGSRERLEPNMVSPAMLELVAKARSQGITYRDLKAHTGSPQGISFWDRIYRLSARAQNVYSLPKRTVDTHEIEIDGRRVRAPMTVLKKLVG